MRACTEGHMNRIAIVLAATLVAGTALADGPAAGTAPNAAAHGAPAGKPHAPATATASLRPGAATVTVRFDSPASEVNIEVSGVDGLVVTSAASPVQGGRFARGQTATFDVAFTEGPGRSHLAVSVTGSFAGARRNRVQTFAVGSPIANQQKPEVPATTDSLGQRIKVMPADGK